MKKVVTTYAKSLFQNVKATKGSDTVFEVAKITSSETNNFGEKRKNKQIKHIINLPIPRNVTDSQGVQYGEGSLNPLEAFGVATVNASINSTPSIDGIKQAFRITISLMNQYIKYI